MAVNAVKDRIQGAISAAMAYCEKHDLRFTEPRRLVLEIIAGSERPVGAYDVLEDMGRKVRDPKPPTAYRALEFLQEHGFIHRIESLNAYVLCGSDHRHQGSQFLICDSCGRVIEAHLCHVPEALAQKAQEQGFFLTRWNAELHGLCKICQQRSGVP